jgi:hypothetical protein
MIALASTFTSARTICGMRGAMVSHSVSNCTHIYCSSVHRRKQNRQDALQFEAHLISTCNLSYSAYLFSFDVHFLQIQVYCYKTNNLLQKFIDPGKLLNVLIEKSETKINVRPLLLSISPKYFLNPEGV